MEPLRFRVVEKTPDEWTDWAMSIPNPEAQREFIRITIESAYKAGYVAGTKHEAGQPYPWPQT